MKRLIKGLKNNSILVSKAVNINYLAGINIFSQTEREAFLLIAKKNNYIFTDGRYKEAVSKMKGFKLSEITVDKPFQTQLEEICRKEKN